MGELPAPCAAAMQHRLSTAVFCQPEHARIRRCPAQHRYPCPSLSDLDMEGSVFSSCEFVPMQTASAMCRRLIPNHAAHRRRGVPAAAVYTQPGLIVENLVSELVPVWDQYDPFHGFRAAPSGNTGALLPGPAYSLTWQQAGRAPAPGGVPFYVLRSTCCTHHARVRYGSFSVTRILCFIPSEPQGSSSSGD